MRLALRLVIALVLLVLSLALAAVMLYGFWLCGFVGVLFKEPGLMAGAVAIWLLMGYLIYYRLRGLGNG